MEDKRLKYLKKELDKAMPSVAHSLMLGFMPVNYKIVESMAQEYYILKNRDKFKKCI